jgi:hypothetical protein
MVELNESEAIGVSSDWKSRRLVVRDLRTYTPSTMTRAIAYNARTDEKNKNNVPESGSYRLSGGLRQMDAIASALEVDQSWKQTLAESLRYLMFSDRVLYFWHCQYDVLFPLMKGQLRLMDWVSMTNSMAFSLMLGWTEQATYQGYLAHASLNQRYQLALSYDEHHRRAQAFMLRLFASWRGNDVAHRWPDWGQDVPIYEEILERWREKDPQALKPWLLAACDRHTHQSRYDSEKYQFDFGDYRVTRTPIEILMVLRLRQLEDLSLPEIAHPMMEAPFDHLPEPQAVLPPDELMQRTLKRAKEDWANFDPVTSLESVKAKSNEPRQS